MAEAPQSDRRHDPTIDAVRQNWKFLGAALAVVLAWNTLKNQVDNLEKSFGPIKERLSLKAYTDFTEWKVNIERDIKELQKPCK